MTPEADSLTRGSRVPHVRVRRLDGTAFDYGQIWQRANLLLVAVPEAAGTAADADDVAWLEALDGARPTLEAYEAVVVVTREPVPGLAGPGVVVADRWGEVAFVETAPRVAALPPLVTLAEWLRFVDHACPECEGEAR